MCVLQLLFAYRTEYSNLKQLYKIDANETTPYIIVTDPRYVSNTNLLKLVTVNHSLFHFKLRMEVYIWIRNPLPIHQIG